MAVSEPVPDADAHMLPLGVQAAVDAATDKGLGVIVTGPVIGPVAGQRPAKVWSCTLHDRVLLPERSVLKTVTVLVNVLEPGLVGVQVFWAKKLGGVC